MIAWALLMLVLSATVAIASELDMVAPAWAWPLAGVCLAAGLFGLYESWRGWCIVRALGIRTPM